MVGRGKGYQVERGRYTVGPSSTAAAIVQMNKPGPNQGTVGQEDYVISSCPKSR